MGKLLLERAKRLLAEAAELSYAVRGNGTGLVGSLVVGCFVTLAPTALPRLLADFAQLHPLVTVDFVEGPQDRREQALLAPMPTSSRGRSSPAAPATRSSCSDPRTS